MYSYRKNIVKSESPNDSMNETECPTYSLDVKMSNSSCSQVFTTKQSLCDKMLTKQYICFKDFRYVYS